MSVALLSYSHNTHAATDTTPPFAWGANIVPETETNQKCKNILMGEMLIQE